MREHDVLEVRVRARSRDRTRLTIAQVTGLPRDPTLHRNRIRSVREEILVVPCDLAAIETARTHWPFLRDRRIDAYGGITQRYAD